MTPAGPASSARRTGALLASLEAGFAIPMLGWLAWASLRAHDSELAWSALFFIACIVVVDLIPIPAWEDIELSLSFPIMIGVAMLYSPPVAGAIALVGSTDVKEFRGEVPVLRALWNRSQMALAIVAGSWAFHGVADALDPWWRLVPGALLASVIAYAINALLVALHGAIEHRVTVREVLDRMHGHRPVEFLLSYIGLALLGTVIARFFLSEGAWSVVVFLAPLVFARQMYFRSRALTDRLARQNETLAEQAERLEHLLRKEHATVDELRELNRMKGDFVAIVSHELRTPVTSVIGYAKTLRQPEFADDPELRAEFLDRLERQSDRLLRLVENLLTTAKLESDQLTVSIGRVLFEDLCREVVEGLASERGRIKVEVPDDLPVLHTDRQLLGRVVSNLLDNALKYSPEGTPCELGARGEGDRLVFWVRDQGVGIAPEQLERIFERFYQADSSPTRRFPGVGLGLSMVRNLLDHLGGAVEVHSAPGEGSTFMVTLPAGGPGGASAVQPRDEDEAGGGRADEAEEAGATRS